MVIGRMDILKFLSRRHSAEAATINDYLRGSSLIQTRLLLYDMVGGDLLTVRKRKVEGNRMASFFQITSNGREKLLANLPTNHHCRELTIA